MSGERKRERERKDRQMGTIVGFVSAWAGSGESPTFSWFVFQSRPTFLKKISSTQYSYSQEAALDIFRTTFILFPVSSSTPADSAAASLLCRQPGLFSRSLSLIPYKLLCIHPSSIFLISSTCTPGSSVLQFSRQEYWSGLPFPPPRESS